MGFWSIFKRVSKVKHTYRAQVVEAVRISYELIGSATNNEDAYKTYALVIRA